MNPDTNEHIEDDFLKKLVSMQNEEKLPEDFTRKVMAGLPVIEAAPADAKKKINFRMIAVIGVIGVAAIFLLFSIDFSGILQAASETSENNPIKYLNLFTSVTKAFSDGFSAFKITSVTGVILLALVSLFAGDRLMKRWFDQNHVEAV